MRNHTRQASLFIVDGLGYTQFWTVAHKVFLLSNSLTFAKHLSTAELELKERTRLGVEPERTGDVDLPLNQGNPTLFFAGHLICLVSRLDSSDRQYQKFPGAQ